MHIQYSGNVAITGMSFRLPGSDNASDLWHNLVAKVNPVSTVPADRWEYDPAFPAPFGSFIDDVGLFDAGFFGISPKEAKAMDPNQRVLLELVWHCVEDAGQLPSRLAGSNTGLYIGSCHNDYKELRDSLNSAVDGYTYSGTCNSILANRISYLYDFQGPSLVTDTACSSSLVSTHMAIQALRSGECDNVLVGSINLMLTPTSHESFNDLGMLSTTGSCKTFDDQADGYARGEGAVVLYLQRLEDAQAAGSFIYAVLKGSAINHGGSARSLTSPNFRSQARVMESALADAEVPSSSVTYVECHGTGTPLGDPIEVHGLKRVYGSAAKAGEPTCFLGAVKTNLGHLEAAAGAAGLVKAVLCLNKKAITPNLHYQRLNPRIDLSDSRLAVAESLVDWDPVDVNGTQLPRRAGVSSFGFGGVNAHVILEEAPRRAANSSTSQIDTQDNSISAMPMLISARSFNSLKLLAEDYANLIDNDVSQFEEICRKTITEREQLPCRMAVPYSTSADALSYLRSINDIDNGQQTHFSRSTTKTQVVFTFTGQGGQRAQMGKYLYFHYQSFRGVLDECNKLFGKIDNRELLEFAFDENEDVVHNTNVTQALLFSFEFAMAKLWQSAGIEPDCLVGHSIGEYAAACIAGVFDLKSACKLVKMRGHLMHEVSIPGAMISCSATQEQVFSVLGQFSSQVDVAAVNAPDQIVLSLPTELADEVADALSTGGIETKKLSTNRPFHSRYMNEVAEQFRETVSGINFAKAHYDIVSTVTGNRSRQELSNPDYWIEQILKPVKFSDAILNLTDSEKSCFLVEMGPSKVLTQLAKLNLAQKTSTFYFAEGANLVAKELDTFIAGIAQAFKAGITIRTDFPSELYNGTNNTSLEESHRIRLPHYRFDQQMHWLSDDNNNTRKGSVSNHPEFQSRFKAQGNEYFVFSIDSNAIMGQSIEQHRVFNSSIIPGAAFIVMAHRILWMVEPDQSSSHANNAVAQIRSLVLIEPLVMPEKGLTKQINGVVSVDDSTGSGTLEFQVGDSAAAVGRKVCEIEFSFDSRTDASEREETAVVDALNAQDVQSLYARFNNAGLNYGKAFRLIRQLNTSADNKCVTALINTSCHELKNITHAGVLAPIIDAALQAAVVLVQDKTDTHLPIPSGFGAVEIVKDTFDAHDFTATVCLVEHSSSAFTVNIQLLDSSGLVASITDAKMSWLLQESFRRYVKPDTESFRSDTSNGVFEQGPAVIVCTPDLRPAPSKNGLVDAQHSERVLFGDRVSVLVVGDALDETLQVQFMQCIGIDWSRIDSIKHLSIASEFENGSAPSPCSDVVVVTSATVALLSDKSFETTTISQQLLLNKVLAYFQRLSSSLSIEDTTRVWLVSKNCFSPHKQVINVFDRGLAALLGSITGEDARLLFKQIDIGDAASNELYSLLQTKLDGSKVFDSSGDVIFTNDGEMSRVNEVINMPVSINQHDGRLKRDAHYLITGGAGGIGRALSEKLVREYGARISLVGRRSIEGVDLPSLGVPQDQIQYVQANIGEAAAFEQATKIAAKKFGSINGIFHAAGVIEDGMASQLSAASFQNVLQPKLTGSRVVGDYAIDNDLDFVVYFSSVSSLLCPSGQSAYACANAWMDAYSEQLSARSDVATYCINWGPWSEVGMAADHSLDASLSLLGLQRISPDAALSTMFTLLQSKPSGRYLVFNGTDECCKQLTVSGLKRSQVDTSVSSAESEEFPDIASHSRDERKQKILYGTVKILSQSLESDVNVLLNSLDSLLRMPLNQLGVDSLAATQVRSKVKLWLGVDVSSELLITGGTLQDFVDQIEERYSIVQLLNNPVVEENNEDEMELLVI